MGKVRIGAEGLKEASPVDLSIVVSSIVTPDPIIQIQEKIIYIQEPAQVIEKTVFVEKPIEVVVYKDREVEVIKEVPVVQEVVVYKDRDVQSIIEVPIYKEKIIYNMEAVFEQKQINRRLSNQNKLLKIAVGSLIILSIIIGVL